MTMPRRICPGTTYLITRRTLRRTHLLRPDSELNNLFVYYLAVIAPRHRILVHAVQVMSTHIHIVLTDVSGCLPRFLQEFHRMVALTVKVLRRWEGPVWDHEKTSAVELRTPQALIEKLAYLMANPTAAGLVRHAQDWPGIKTLPDDLGKTLLSAKRPTQYLDQDNTMWPSEATLPLSLPPEIDMAEGDLRDAVANELALLESAAHEDVRTKGWRVAGARVIERLSPFARARSSEPLRSRNPSFAVGRGQREAFAESVRLLRSFRQAYMRALERWRAGIRKETFPHGTWLMARLHCVAIAAG
jgi:hypothetical protein